MSTPLQASADQCRTELRMLDVTDPQIIPRPHDATSYLAIGAAPKRGVVYVTLGIVRDLRAGVELSKLPTAFAARQWMRKFRTAAKDEAWAKSVEDALHEAVRFTWPGSGGLRPIAAI